MRAVSLNPINRLVFKYRISFRILPVRFACMHRQTPESFVSLPGAMNCNSLLSMQTTNILGRFWTCCAWHLVFEVEAGYCCTISGSVALVLPGRSAVRRHMAQHLAQSGSLAGFPPAKSPAEI